MAHLKNRFTCSVEPKPVKQEVRFMAFFMIATGLRVIIRLELGLPIYNFFDVFNLLLNPNFF